jgi:hypothetical protein
VQNDDAIALCATDLRYPLLQFTPPLLGDRAAFKSFLWAGLAQKKMTFVRFWLSHRMCVSNKSMSHTEVVMSLDQSVQSKNPVSALPPSGRQSAMEGNRAEALSG